VPVNHVPLEGGKGRRLSPLGIGILGENAQNLAAGVHQPKAVRFLPGMALGYIMGPQFSGSDRLGGARQDRGFPLDKNASLEPIDCEQFDPLSATNAGRPKITAARKKRIRKLD
jgi:hypothetical protein